MFESKFEALPGIWQKAITGFDCKVYGSALGAKEDRMPAGKHEHRAFLSLLQLLLAKTSSKRPLLQY